jgi:aminoglycoside 6'-N-acetyltransferase
VDLDVFLSSAHHGRGLGTDALPTVLRHMFEDGGHHRATLYTDPKNERAIRCYSRLGFESGSGDGPSAREMDRGGTS